MDLFSSQRVKAQIQYRCAEWRWLLFQIFVTATSNQAWNGWTSLNTAQHPAAGLTASSSSLQDLNFEYFQSQNMFNHHQSMSTVGKKTQTPVNKRQSQARCMIDMPLIENSSYQTETQSAMTFPKMKAQKFCQCNKEGLWEPRKMWGAGSSIWNRYAGCVPGRAEIILGTWLQFSIIFCTALYNILKNTETLWSCHVSIRLQHCQQIWRQQMWFKKVKNVLFVGLNVFLTWFTARTTVSSP